LERYKDIQVTEDAIDTLIHSQANRVVVRLGPHKLTFAGIHTPPHERYTQARNFLLQLCNASKLTGTPLESHLPRQESKDPAGSGEKSEVR
jgi:hypothetical protein